MKRKIMIVMEVVVLILLVATPAYAATMDIEERYYESVTFNDGSYIKIETIEEKPSVSLFAVANVKRASRTYTYYEANNVKAWDFIIKGTFSYDGNRAKATAVSTDYNIYISGWDLISREATKNGATVSATGKFKYNFLSKVANIGLKCSAKGTISSL